MNDKNKTGEFPVSLVIVVLIAVFFLARSVLHSHDLAASDRDTRTEESADDGGQENELSDTFRPLVWFDGKADAYELYDWDTSEDGSVTGVCFIVEDDADTARQIFQAYADQLSEEDCLQEMSRQQYERDSGGSGQEACYTYTGGESVGKVRSSYSLTRCDLTVCLMLPQDGDGFIELIWGDGFPMDIAPYDTGIERVYYMTDSEDVGEIVSTDAAETVSTPVPTPVTSGDGILPDAHAFFNGELIHTEEDITNGTKAVFSVKQEYAAAMYEYVDLLNSGRFGLTLRQTITDEHSGSDMTYEYFFDYTGSRDVDQVSLYTNSDYVYGAVIVRVNDWPKWGWCEMSIDFSDDLTVADTGDRCSITGLVDDTENGFSGPMGGGYSSPGGGIDWDDDDDGGRTRCTHCNGGTRTCLTCDGKGYIEEYVSVPNYSGSTFGSNSGWERHDCPNSLCHDGEVDCNYCGGDGWID